MAASTSRKNVVLGERQLVRTESSCTQSEGKSAERIEQFVKCQSYWLNVDEAGMRECPKILLAQTAGKASTSSFCTGENYAANCLTTVCTVAPVSHQNE
jgi:hypothetical protein